MGRFLYGLYPRLKQVNALFRSAFHFRTFDAYLKVMTLPFIFRYFSLNEARSPAATRKICFEVVSRAYLGLALVLLCLLFLIGTIRAQQDSPFFRNDSQKKVESAVHNGLGELWQCDDHVELMQEFPEAKGTIEFEITLKRKGEVESVRKTDATIEDLKFMNALQHLIFDTKFKFKLKKGNKHTMYYTYTNLKNN